MMYDIVCTICAYTQKIVEAAYAGEVKLELIHDAAGIIVGTLIMAFVLAAFAMTMKYFRYINDNTKR